MGDAAASSAQPRGAAASPRAWHLLEIRGVARTGHRRAKLLDVVAEALTTQTFVRLAPLAPLLLLHKGLAMRAVANFRSRIIINRLSPKDLENRQTRSTARQTVKRGCSST